MRKRMIWAAALLLAAFLALLVLAGCCNAWARKVLQKSMATARCEPGTDILLGGGPVVKDRGRRRACLLLHGFMGTPADFGDLPDAIDRAGWDVHAPLLPGHGTDPRRLEGLTAADMLGAAERDLRAMRERYETLVLVGFSMSGAMAVVLSDRVLPDGLVLVNPYFASPYRLRYVLPPRTWHWLLSPFLGYAVRPRGMASVNRPEAADQVVCYRVIPIGAFRTVFDIADSARSGTLPDRPLLVLLSEQDGTASSRASRDFYDAAGVTQKALMAFPRSDHLLFLDYDREEAVERLLEFLHSVAPEGR